LHGLAIQEQIAQLSSFSTAGGERQDALEAVLAAISRLNNEVADAAEYVPSYDLRTYTQTVRALSDQLNETSARIAPKSRFQFKRGTASDSSAGKPDPRRLVGPGGGPALASAADTAPATAPPVDAVPAKDYNAELSRSSTPGVRKPSFSSARDIVLAGPEGLHIVLPASAAHATSAGALTDLRRCVVDMSAPTVRAADGAAEFASLAVKNLDRCLVVAGRVSGSVHLTNVKDSVLVISARQVRMHECENVDVYLWCASHPIIEDCRRVRFAPLPACYVSIETPAMATEAR
jgi:tubulin-specific chaperone C